MSRKTWHEFQTTLPHHEDSEAVMKVSVEVGHDQETLVTVEVEKHRVTLTRAEIRKIYDIAEAFDTCKYKMEEVAHG